MVGWLKFYFLGFICDKYGKQASTRSFLNVLLSLILSVILLCAGIAVGYTASFATHYNNADEFREFLYATFAGEDSCANLTFQRGKLDAQISGGASINTFNYDEDRLFNGYRLIVDTRPAETTYDDFVLICKDANGAEVSYEDYKNLPEQGQKNGSITFVYTGNALDVTAKQAEYIAYLDRLSNETSNDYDATVSAAYSQLKHKKSVGELSESEYCNGIYELYAKSYYPDYSDVEIYGNAPTLRTYYMQAQLIEGVDKYLIFLDDLSLCSFVTSNGIVVNFGTYYGSMDDKIITADNMTYSEMQTNVDSFITKCFKDGGGFNFLVTLMNIGKFVLLLIVAILVLSLLVLIICKAVQLDVGSKYFGTLKIICAYLLYTAVLTFLTQIVLSFFLSRNTVFLVSEIVFVSILTLRTVALLIAEIIRKNKITPEQTPGDLPET